VAVATITSAAIQSGPGRIYYAPLGTAIPTITAAASKITATWTSWVQVGATDAGLTYTESAETADINGRRVAVPDPHGRDRQEQPGRVHPERDHDLNWKLAMNGGTAHQLGCGRSRS
jgi:hypothetical protein